MYQRAPKEGGAGPFGGMGARPRLLKYSCTCLGISAKTCLASSAGDFYGKERNNIQNYSQLLFDVAVRSVLVIYQTRHVEF